MMARRTAGRARKSPARRLGKFSLFLLALAVIAIVLIVLLVLVWLKPGPVPPIGPQTPSTPSKERPEAQPADCPDVLTVVIPGTWESSATDDPYAPSANPNSLMLRVSRALSKEFDSSRTEIYTVPYTAQFRNPTNLADRQADYNVSRTQGYQRAAGKIINTNKRCPLTSYVLMGFSQGAVIAGDLASNIGNGRGVLEDGDQDLVLGVGLIADGRRQPGKQNDVDPSPDGVGAEIALGGMGNIVPGITMTGPRNGGFGDLEDRVQSICAPGDLICDSPTVLNPLAAVSKLANAASNPIHAMYATPKYWEADGRTATQWMYAWARDLIDEAPRPAHE
ncbi:cutinase family protein [Gordonia rubripertincta]|uniref:Cutinase family protein n=1 Tax=Gordonia rubripertincta TaxID=36822 RepID=A0AAW4G970_GORRU|nr:MULTISPECIES: cutinase family protein [Gordonia]MBM7280178.1 cutinase family protein [Gordonia rubripertincta]QMU21954.1 cutinase family protein [Gordonia rubripertincta]TSD95739.1 cutinase family protein [Gordonia rubripertincta]